MAVTQPDANSVAIVLVAIVTAVSTIITVVIQTRTRREVQSPNGVSTGQAVYSIAEEQKRVARELKLTKKQMDELHGDVKENLRGTTDLAVALGDHLCEVQALGDLVAWAKLHMLDDHRQGRRLPTREM